MLRWRLVLGVLLIAAIGVLCWLDYAAVRPGTILIPLAVVTALVATEELLQLLSGQTYRPIRMVVHACNLLIVASNGIPLLWDLGAGDASSFAISARGSIWPFIGLGIGILTVFTGEMYRYRRPGGIVVQVALGVFALVYVGMLLSFMVQLRLFGSDGQGLTALVSLVAVVKSGDIGAYTLGRLFGRHKMAPLLSPGKTWEGAAGAVLFSCLASWLVFTYLEPALTDEPRLSTLPTSPTWGWLAYGVVVGIAGLLGDLAESLLKRDLGRKDSSAWVPGFGGVLDVLDSLLLAAPVAYLFWLTGIVGQ